MDLRTKALICSRVMASFTYCIELNAESLKHTSKSVERYAFHIWNMCPYMYTHCDLYLFYYLKCMSITHIRYQFSYEHLCFS